MTTIHFAYSWPGFNLDGLPPLNSPYTISYYLGRRLRAEAQARGWGFRWHDWGDTTMPTIALQDIVIGHTKFDGGFMDYGLQSGARLRLILQPYSHYMVSPGDTARMVDILRTADHCFLVTGEYWWDTMEQSDYASVKDNATRLDMAVDAQQHEFHRQRWNPKGQRRMCYIGTTIPAKGVDAVARLAEQSGIALGYVGADKTEVFRHVPVMFRHGGQTMNAATVRKLVDFYDFFVTMGTADANPTTLLETAAWGMIGLCTEKSGYWPDRPFLELKNNPQHTAESDRFNLEQMDALQQMDEYDLWLHVQKMRMLVESQYTWERFTDTVWQKIEGML